MEIQSTNGVRNVKSRKIKKISCKVAFGEVYSSYYAEEEEVLQVPDLNKDLNGSQQERLQAVVHVSQW